MSNYPYIDSLYIDYREELLLDDRRRPAKSITRNINNTFLAFREYYIYSGIQKLCIANILECFHHKTLNDTVRTNIRSMVELKLLKNEGENYYYTETFYNAIAKNKNAREILEEQLYSIDSVENITMYLNTILCVLREGYLQGRIISFPDSFREFANKVDEYKDRVNLCKMVYDIYGFHGRKSSYDMADYSPNPSYRVLTELRNLGLIELSSEEVYGMNTYKLTEKAYKVLEVINNNVANFQKFNSVNIWIELQ